MYRCCRQSAYDPFAPSADHDDVITSRDHSVTSRDVHSFEVEGHEKKSQPLQNDVLCSESSWHDRDRGLDSLKSVSSMCMSNQQIFDLMKVRVNDHKSSEERTASHTTAVTQTEHRGDDKTSGYHSHDMAQHLTRGVETANWTGGTQGSDHHHLSSNSRHFHPGDVYLDERQYSSYSRGQVPADVSSRSAMNFFDYSHGPVVAGEGPVHSSHQPQPASDLGETRGVEWLDTWTSGTEDFDLRNYRKHY